MREQDKTENLAMAWIDYKKAYDMVPQSWILHCLKMYKIPHEVTMKTDHENRTDHENLESGADSRRKKNS